MRRAALPVAAVGILIISWVPWALPWPWPFAARIAQAEPWTVTMESGAEADTNVERVETGSGLMTSRIAAPVGRAGARIENKDRVLGGAYAVDVSGLARMVANSDAKAENVMLYTADARWLHAIEARPLAVGLAVTAADALAITGGTGARTFRNLGADGLVALGGGEDHHLTLAVGVRDFKYKPSPQFNWRGAVANARFDVVLWQTSGKLKSLELATALGFEQRGFASVTTSDICPPGAPPSSQCTTPTSLPRRDRYQRASAELTWTGDIVATAGYQLTVIDSNSYGQSLVRHRITSSVTAELASQLFGTATATLQIDQYPDGVVVETDIARQEFTNLEDENRSSLQVLVTRKLSPTWSLEARGAVWRDFGNTGTASFRRELVYGGAIYSR